MKCRRFPGRPRNEYVRFHHKRYAMTFEEIAKELGMTYAAVWMTYKRAIRKLRASYGRSL